MHVGCLYCCNELCSVQSVEIDSCCSKSSECEIVLHEDLIVCPDAPIAFYLGSVSGNSDFFIVYALTQISTNPAFLAYNNPKQKEVASANMSSQSSAGYVEVTNEIDACPFEGIHGI